MSGSDAAQGRRSTRARGRPADPQLAERRRRELVVAAYEVFAERGYAAAGIADIAERLDIGHGTFYRYFESKREILDHVVDYVVQRIAEAIQADVQVEAGDLDELLGQLRATGGRLFELLDAEPGIVQVLLFEATGIDEQLTLRVLGLVDVFAGVLDAALEHGRRQGFVRDDLDVWAVAQGVNAMILPAWIAMLRGGVSPARRDRLLDGLVDFVRAGIQPR